MREDLYGGISRKQTHLLAFPFQIHHLHCIHQKNTKKRKLKTLRGEEGEPLKDRERSREGEGQSIPSSLCRVFFVVALMSSLG